VPLGMRTTDSSSAPLKPVMNFFRSTMSLLISVIVGVLFWAHDGPAQETQRQKPEQQSQQNQYRDQAQSTQFDQYQRGTQSYTGKVSEKYGKFYLEEAHSRSSYLLEGIWQAKRFLNKKVRISGWLDTDKNILHTVSISVAH
jgi:hypothetical protein